MKPDLVFPSTEFDQRLERLSRRTAKAGADAFLVETEVNRLYLTGFKSTNGVLVVQPGETPCFYTDFRYIEMARGQISFAEVRKLDDFPAEFGALAKKSKWRRVGYEGSISVTRFRAFREAMPSVPEWIESEDLILELRLIKSRREQALIRAAVRLGDQVYRRAIEDARPGMSEWDIRRVLLRRVLETDAEGESFDCIVSAGPNASKPHARVTRRVLRRNQPLLIDMGLRYRNYCSDMTRTVFFGRPSDKMRAVYGIVLRAQEKGIEAVRAGKTCEEIDAAARRVVEKAGYGGRFGHGLGHGVGLQVHEPPRLKAGDQTVLRAGMVITIEPGIYLPGVGGVRIEDMVIVRENGCEVLTKTPKELICF